MARGDRWAGFKLKREKAACLPVGSLWMAASCSSGDSAPNRGSTRTLGRPLATRLPQRHQRNSPQDMPAGPTSFIHSGEQGLPQAARCVTQRQVNGCVTKPCIRATSGCKGNEFRSAHMRCTCRMSPAPGRKHSTSPVGFSARASCTADATADAVSSLLLPIRASQQHFQRHTIQPPVDKRRRNECPCLELPGTCS